METRHSHSSAEKNDAHPIGCFLFIRIMANKKSGMNRNLYLVREKGLEPSRPEALAPKASVSTNSTTRAHQDI